jgi:hypothetical protein
MTPDELRRLDDPIANFVLKGGSCPLTVTQIAEKLNTSDDCTASPFPQGETTRFVSDRAQLLRAPDTYRAVVKRQCNGRTDRDLFMSLFGITTEIDPKSKAVQHVSVPDDTVELIGEQKSKGPDGKTRGVFNFYAREDKQWKFFGSSTDFLSQGYDCNEDGSCIPKAGAKQRCASCHPGGGLNMKELESPWINWDVGGMPGAADLLKAAPTLFGGHGTGVDLEVSVESGNRLDWIPARIDFAKTLGLKEILRPLFCTVDMNLQTMNGSPSNTKEDQFVGKDFFVDRLFRADDGMGVTFAAADYQAALVAIGQTITDGRTGRPLDALGSDGKTPMRDSLFGFIYPRKSTQDTDYVRELVSRGIVDMDLVKDVLHVDFTRPIYSPMRCGLLALVPEVPSAQMSAAAVKTNLAAAAAQVTTLAAKQLAKNLADPKDEAAHDADIGRFLDACVARGKSDRAGLLRDVLAYGHHLKNAAKRAKQKVSGQGIIEFAETLPDIPGDPDDRTGETTEAFDPATCTLR